MPTFISELHIQGYKRLRDVKLKLGPLNVLIGPNASGKTSVLEVLDLLSRSAQGGLRERLRSLGGMPSVLSREKDRYHFAIAAALPSLVTAGPFVYGLHLTDTGLGHAISSEELTGPAPSGDDGALRYLGRDPGGVVYHDLAARGESKGDFVKKPGETALAQFPTFAQWQEGNPVCWLRSLLGEAQRYVPFDAGEEAPIRRPQQVAPVHLPGPRGGDLVAALQTRRSRDPEMYDVLEDTLRTAYPGFHSLGMEPVAAGQGVLTWRERDRVLYANQLSEGTLRFLWLAAILLVSDMPPLVMIDEPEVSLHPELLKILSDLLDNASNRTQLIVATQSPELISWLKPEQIVVLDLDEEGWATATPGSEMDLEHWLERYTLGQLWTRGVLGGRP